eukprot:jgi/Astpho2/4250/fgenesh1_pg.00064_%23_54_t
MPGGEMGELHVFKYVCPKDGWFSTKYWDTYTGHVANHVRDKELEDSWRVPKGLKQWPLWKLQMGRRWAVNELTKEEIHPCLCRKLEQDNKDLKSQLTTVQANLAYAERLKKEADQQCAEARVECNKAQQVARHYEVQFSQNLKPQFEALQRENAQLREQLGASGGPMGGTHDGGAETAALQQQLAAVRVELEQAQKAKAELEAQQKMQQEQLEQAAAHSAQLQGQLAQANSGSAAREEVERFRQEAEAANAKAAAIVEEFEILKAEWREEAQKWGQDLFKGNQEQYQKGFKDGQRVGMGKNGQNHKRERENGGKEEKVPPPKRDKH